MFVLVSSRYVLAVVCFLLFFFTVTATTEIYTLSLHDALPIYRPACASGNGPAQPGARRRRRAQLRCQCPTPPASTDRKSTRLNSSHEWISYAVFCLKKKKKVQYSDRGTHREGHPLLHSDDIVY